MERWNGIWNGFSSQNSATEKPQDLYRTKAQTREGVDTRNSSLATYIHCVAKPQIIFTSLHAKIQQQRSHKTYTGLKLRLEKA